MSFASLEAARAEAERFLALGRSLDATEWSLDSRCDGWSVADVVGHLADDCDRYTEWLEASIAGRLEPPFPPEHFRADNALMLERHTGVPGPARLKVFEAAFDRWAARASATAPATPQRHPRGATTLDRQAWFAAGEIAIHGWDIATALGRDWDPPAATKPIANAWREGGLLAPGADESWSAMLVASGRRP